VTLVDSHTHLDDRRFTDDRDAVVQRAVDAGVSRMLSIGTGEGPPDLEAAIRIAEQYEPVYASVGIHPEHAPVATQEHFDRLGELLRHPKVLLLGEIGLDYYWKPYDAKLQAHVFVQQMRIAEAARKPISIHTHEPPGTTRLRCCRRIGRRRHCPASCTVSPAVPSRHGKPWTSGST
jgi:TatD DNase family protein